MIKDVTDLEVYNLSLELLEPLYKLSNTLGLDKFIQRVEEIIENR